MAKVICVLELEDGCYNPPVFFVDLDQMDDANPYKLAVLATLNKKPDWYGNKTKKITFDTADTKGGLVDFPCLVEDRVVLYLDG